jgi:hypothetical protein
MHTIATRYWVPAREALGVRRSASLLHPVFALAGAEPNRTQPNSRNFIFLPKIRSTRSTNGKLCAQENAISEPFPLVQPSKQT